MMSNARSIMPVSNGFLRKSVIVSMSYRFGMTHLAPRSVVLAFALLVGASVPSVVEAGESHRAALVRVQVIEQDGTSRVQTSRAVWWDATASLRVKVGEHQHDIAVTPSQNGRGVAISVDHSRDGSVLADDERVTSTQRRVVLDHGGTKIVVTVVPTTMHIDAE